MTDIGKCFTGLYTKCTGYKGKLVIAPQNRPRGANGVVVKSFDCNNIISVQEFNHRT